MLLLTYYSHDTLQGPCRKKSQFQTCSFALFNFFLSSLYFFVSLFIFSLFPLFVFFSVLLSLPMQVFPVLSNRDFCGAGNVPYLHGLVQ